MLSDRVSTGNVEFDKLIGGGFPKNSLILLAGSPGAGKTAFSASFIYHGAVNHGEPGVYVCFNESRDRFLRDVKEFGMDFETLIKRGKVSVLDLSLVTEVDVQSALNQILEAITTLSAKRLVIDSITSLFAGLKSELEKRHILRLLYSCTENRVHNHNHCGDALGVKLHRKRHRGVHGGWDNPHGKPLQQQRNLREAH